MAGADGAPATRRSNHIVVVLHRGVRVVLIAGTVVLLARLWLGDLWAMAESTAGVTVVRAALRILVTLLLVSIGWELIKAAIDRKLLAGEGEDEGRTAGDRARTLLPLIRNFLLATLVVMAAMIVLSSLGVDIGPLLAGAGVIGLAVGFGAQTLVRDIVSGVFFLIDDAFRVGEYVEMGELRGTVESISVRSLRLRHHRGKVHTIPFGELRSLTNYSRDWVIEKMELRVHEDTDVDKVKRLMKQLGRELMEDPAFAGNMLEPLKSQGVSRFEDGTMVIRVKFTAKPGEQFLIRREAYKRIYKLFEDNGIRLAHRHVTVHVPDADQTGDVAAAKGAAGRVPAPVVAAVAEEVLAKDGST